VFEMQEKVTNPPTQINLIDDDYGNIAFELFLFTTNMKKEVCDVLKSFLSLLRRYEERKSHNMLCLMLDSRFKSLCLISSFIGREKGLNIVEKYDRQSLYSMFLKWYHYLHLMSKFEVECTCQNNIRKF
jgi:hypothetical protein